MFRTLNLSAYTDLKFFILLFNTYFDFLGLSSNGQSGFGMGFFRDPQSRIARFFILC